jgi:hypothetical protein
LPVSDRDLNLSACEIWTRRAVELLTIGEEVPLIRYDTVTTISVGVKRLTRVKLDHRVTHHGDAIISDANGRR